MTQSRKSESAILLPPIPDGFSRPRERQSYAFSKLNILELRQILLVQLFRSARHCHIFIIRSTMTLLVRLFGKGSLVGISHPPLVIIPTTKLFNLTSLLTKIYVSCKREQRCTNVLKDPKCSKVWVLGTWLEDACWNAGHPGYRSGHTFFIPSQSIFENSQHPLLPSENTE